VGNAAAPRLTSLFAALVSILLLTGLASAATGVPQNTALPAITGTGSVGSVLTASTGSWSNTPTSYTYSWHRCDTIGASCINIGVSSNKYTLVAADQGKTLRVGVTATNALGSGKAASLPSAVVAATSASSAAPQNTALPTISGSARVAQTLTANKGTWTASPISYAYQWQSCDSAGASCAAISGATTSTRLLATSDQGRTLRVIVKATNTGGATSATSAPTAVVAAATTTTPSLPSTSGQLFGFSESQGPGSPDVMSNAQMTAHFQAEKAAGATVTRLTVDVQNDTQFGNQFQLAKAAGLKVIAVIAGQTATGASAYAQRAQWAAQTYGSQGLYKIELGNEWNLHGFTPVLAASYQKAAYSAIKSVCPSCRVISNGLAEWGRYVDGTTNPVRFLELEYAAGLRGSFDELGWHPYYYNNNWTAAQMLSLTDPWSGMAQLGSLTLSARSLMIANGDGAKKITATEWGAPTDDAGDGFTAGVTPAEQANLMTQGIAWWKQQSWAGDLIAYEYQDIANSPTDRECHFGLVDYNGTAKPALAAYKNAVP
jgi:hypothetical protein